MNVQSSTEEQDKAVKILARSLYKELTGQGYGSKQIVALSSELLHLLTSSYRPTEDEAQAS